jgi:hypothetical protein
VEFTASAVRIGCGPAVVTAAGLPSLPMRSTSVDSAFVSFTSPNVNTLAPSEIADVSSRSYVLATTAGLAPRLADITLECCF